MSNGPYRTAAEPTENNVCTCTDQIDTYGSKNPVSDVLKHKKYYKNHEHHCHFYIEGSAIAAHNRYIDDVEKRFLPIAASIFRRNSIEYLEAKDVWDLAEQLYKEGLSRKKRYD